MQNYMNMGIKPTQNFTLISKLLRKMPKKLLTKKLWAKKVRKVGVCHLQYKTNLQTFLANNFFCVHIFPIISKDSKSA
jgi:hypothetical protein